MTTKIKVRENDLGEVTLGDNTYYGKIVMVDGALGEAVVDFGGGDRLVIKTADIRVKPKQKIFESIPVQTSKPGFNQYPIEWSDQRGNVLQFNGKKGDDPKSAIRFKLLHKGFLFAGSWMRIVSQDDEPGYEILIYAKTGERYFILPPLQYFAGDPRLPSQVREMSEGGDDVTVQYSGIRELNSDICTAVNRWVHFHAGGSIETLADIRTAAEFPFIKVDKLETLKKMIDSLAAVYNKSVSSGGQRSIKLKGDDPDLPSVRIEVDVTSEVITAIEENRLREMSSITPILEEVSRGVPQPDNGSVLPTPKITSPGKRGRPSLSPKVTGSVSQLKATLKKILEIPKRDRSSLELRTERKIRAVLREKKRRGNS